MSWLSCKYKNSSCAIVNEVELRHELRDRVSKIEILIKQLAKKLNIKTIIVTAGKKGAYLYQKNKNKIIFCPGFAKNVVDSIGAGDAMLAFFSLFLSTNNKDYELGLFLSSMATAQVTENYGNKQKISFNKLLKSVLYILK